MTQHYSDPKRESDPHALPDLEVWCDAVTVIRSKHGTFEVPAKSEDARGFCPECGKATCVNEIDGTDESGIERTGRKEWFYWFCFPGCLPDGEPMGPFATEAEALEDARQGNEPDDDDDEPQEDDYYLSDDERSVTYHGKVIAGPVSWDAEPCMQDAVMRELAAYVKRDPAGYAPNVWKYSDHGNASLISVMECGCYFTEHDGEVSKHGAEVGRD